MKIQIEKNDGDDSPVKRLFDRFAAGDTFLLSALLTFLVLWAFMPATQNAFVNYDDDGYVVTNPHIQDGITLENIEWAFTSGYASNWHPVTWLSHMLDCELFGLNPGAHHLVNVLWHVVDTLLVFFVLRRMTGAGWRSWLVAALFGLHPAHVESVAWVAERKDVLSAFFWMLTLWGYVRYVEEFKAQGNKTRFYYGLTLAFFSLGLMSKPMLVTLPCVLLLLDHWPLARTGVVPLRRLVLEKVPFLALAAGSSVVTYLVQQHGGAMKSLAGVSLVERAGNAFVSYWRYLGELFWPVHLVVFYPYHSWGTVVMLLAAVALALVTIAVLLQKTRPDLKVGWLWFVGTLVPVIGVVQVGAQAMADRYTYIPSLGVFIMIAWSIPAGEARARRTLVIAGTTAVILLVCLALTRVQVGYWKSSETLFRHVIAFTEENSPSHYTLGNALAKQGRLDEAQAEFERALVLKPDYLVAINDLGLIFSRQGHSEKAVKQFREAIRLQPTYAPPHYNLAEELRAKGQLDEAIAEFNEAIKLNPEDADAHNNLGTTLASKGELDAAIHEFQEAVRHKPADFEARFNLAFELAATRRYDEAIVQFIELLNRRPADAELHYYLGLALSGNNRAQQAAAEFNEALRLRPDYPEAEKQLRNLSAPPKP